MNEFDAKAEGWDGDPMKVERARRVADAILEQAGPLSGKRAMDYGCGTGLLGFALQPHLAHMTLADASPGMLAVLGKKIAASGLANLAPLALDLTGGPDPGTRFDLIVTLMTLHHIPDTDGILQRFHGILNPGGLLGISDLDQEDGSFHGLEADVHRGFDRSDLCGRLERAGFGRIRFSTPYVINRETGAGMTPFPLFLVLAERT
jgi:2-polyprenyl-3-methyl-5-hydroxy-6-metoxy-1,4-benzoquinol methylase